MACSFLVFQYVIALLTLIIVGAGLMLAVVVVARTQRLP